MDITPESNEMYLSEIIHKIQIAERTGVPSKDFFRIFSQLRGTQVPTQFVTSDKSGEIVSEYGRNVSLFHSFIQSENFFIA